MHPSRPAPVAVVLVHGAFAGTSSWAGVTPLLRRAGVSVHTPVNPLRGLATDSAYLADVVRRIGRPVVLVGHGYGGAVVTQAATCADNVVALAYVAAFALDTGECLLDVVDRFAPMPLAHTALTVGPGSAGRELLLRPHRFPQAYAADLPLPIGRELSRAQRPLAPAALTDRSGAPAWARIPAWYALATADRLLNPSAQRFMAQRMAAHEHPVDGSHALPLSRPAAVAAMIMAAARGTDPGDRW
jgi:pimeloyl-ACP methyl ester carboxylesterase